MDFITSDLHFSHKRIAEYCPWSRGHYASVEEMNEGLISRYNEKVGPNDHTYILGDIGFCSAGDTMRFLARLNGTKTIIHGNHDAKMIKTTEFNSIDNRALAGIVADYPYLEIKVNKVDVILFHYKIDSWNKRGHGSMHLHGHLHSRKDQEINVRRMDIGCDTNDLYPYKLEEVVEFLKDKPFFEDRPNHTPEGRSM